MQNIVLLENQLQEEKYMCKNNCTGCTIVETPEEKNVNLEESSKESTDNLPKESLSIPDNVILSDN